MSAPLGTARCYASLQPILRARADALAAGEIRYFTGRPCCRGHVCERYSKTQICVECSRIVKHEPRVRAQANVRRRRYNAANPEKNRARVKAWRKANPEKRRAAHKRYAKKNAAKLRASREKKKEQLRAYHRQKYLRNKQRHLTYSRNRKARLRAASGRHGVRDIRSIFSAQQGRCAYCRVKLPTFGYHVDHIFPLNLGGANDRKNLQITCAACNCSKQDKDPIEFARYRGLLL